jgi:hypothetical protein
MSSAKVYFDLFHSSETNDFNISELIWNRIKLNHDFTNQRFNNPITILDLIKKFCIFLPQIKFEVYADLYGEISNEDLTNLFKKNVIEHFQNMPFLSTLQKIKKFYMQLYYFEIYALISCINGGFEPITFPILQTSSHVEERTIEIIPSLVENGHKVLKGIVIMINRLEKKHRQECFDKKNIKLLSSKYPNVTHPIQHIVSKFL